MRLSSYLISMHHVELLLIQYDLLLSVEDKRVLVRLESEIRKLLTRFKCQTALDYFPRDDIYEILSGLCEVRRKMAHMVINGTTQGSVCKILDFPPQAPS